MNTLTIGSIFAVFALMMVAPSAFADHETVYVSIPEGTSLPGCQVTDECFIPSVVVIDVGSEVVWTNDDTAGHTVTSGSMQTGPEGHFDSGLFMAGGSYSNIFEEAGEFPYYCMVHPWMEGTVVVQEHGTGQNGDQVPGQEGFATAMTSDGSLIVNIYGDVPTAGEELLLEVEFTDAQGESNEHVNYEISVTQDGMLVLSEDAHAHPGAIGLHLTDALQSDSPVNVQVTILGFGLPGTDSATWTGPVGETVSVQVVPEFGQIAMMILAVAIVSIVAVTTKSKVIPRL